MRLPTLLAVSAAILMAFNAAAQTSFERDTIKTTAGDLEITFIGHGTLMFRFGGKTIHVDPWTALADYSTLPKADLILITHHHQDHFDSKAIGIVRTEKTTVIGTQKCSDMLEGMTVMKNGDVRTVDGIRIEAVPAYNVVHKRPDGTPFHPRGEGNGYILTFGKTRVYVAGDTEGTPEMKSLNSIDIAFLPMNLPYTMTPEMVAEAARAFKPKILYPYHYGDSDTGVLTALLKSDRGIEVRLRKML